MKDNNQIIIDGLMARIRELEISNQTSITECVRNVQNDTISVQELLSQPIGNFFKSLRVVNCLKAEKIETISDLVQKTETDLLKIPNFAHSSLETVIETLEGMHLSIGIDFDDYIEFGEKQRIAEFKHYLMKERDKVKKGMKQHNISQKTLGAYEHRLQKIKEMLHNL